MGYVDEARAQTLLARAGIDGLLVVSPENFEYFSGVSGFPATMWRRAGPASAIFAGNQHGHPAIAFVVPETIAEAVARVNPNAQVLSYPLWIESVDVATVGCSGDPIETRIAQAVETRASGRPEVYDSALVDRLLQAALHAVGLAGKRVGVEMEFAPAADVMRFGGLFGHTELVDSSRLVRELRLIKSPAEIDLLRRGVALTEHGIMAALQAIDEQTLAADIRNRFTEACHAEARRRREMGLRSASTGMHLGPNLWAMTDPARLAQRGDLVQFDSSVQIHGYKTDMGRTFSYGKPTDDQQHIQDALLAGFRAGLAEMKPGNRFCDVFQAVHRAVRGAGFPSYTRGHVGHSIGSDVDGEEWPWISATQTQRLEPGMVLAFEVPYYINGIGGFQNEDDILITETGFESFNSLPLELTDVESVY